MQKKTILPLSAAIAFLSMGIAANSQAQLVSCGDVITTPTTLDANLVCPIADADSVAIVIEGPGGSLSMGDYSLTCSTSAFGSGIVLLGQGARLSGGTVTGCGDAVTLGGDGSHFVTNVYITDFGDDAVYIDSNNNVVTNMEIVGDDWDSDEGIDIAGHNNVVNFNYIEGAGDEGIEIAGDFNIVSSNEVLGSANDGIEIDGAFANVTNNYTHHNGSSGIEVDGNFGTIFSNTVANNDGGVDLDQGTSNVINNNTVSDNGTYGIFIFDAEPTNNTISNNTSLGHTYDLFDAVDFDCSGDNTWENNTFSTSQPACLE
ncbi:right-handed parallel beta-helix repeat-containing protein [Microbulbifer sp. OS29]|uniref:Right-handed parallel beta-helix repeat-containing protein n=1 Tax=Microbulbifer okhotskensis TaxID=2926617 RepID=A0A9X2J6S0_9GAMM|nr:right-handed parallel beta-helix repeat-containing protein [Microbulbifer okhotskensis]MCO1335714.1 right-handed parallel beta-helix repeat-containing protein [Microbulbifer okhotskensis]